MPKFMIMASYTVEGTKGLIGEGGSSRKAAVEKMLGAMGAKLESFYYAFGETDVYAVVDMPDSVSALAASLAINSSGAVTNELIPLITVEDVDAACKKSVNYRAPGR